MKVVTVFLYPIARRRPHLPTSLLFRLKSWCTCRAIFWTAGVRFAYLARLFVEGG